MTVFVRRCLLLRVKLDHKKESVTQVPWGINNLAYFLLAGLARYTHHFQADVIFDFQLPRQSATPRVGGSNASRIPPGQDKLLVEKSYNSFYYTRRGVVGRCRRNGGQA